MRDVSSARKPGPGSGKAKVSSSGTEGERVEWGWVGRTGGVGGRTRTSESPPAVRMGAGRLLGAGKSS